MDNALEMGLEGIDSHQSAALDLQFNQVETHRLLFTIDYIIVIRCL